MNKKELVAAVAKDTGLTKADAERALKSILANITKAVKKGVVTLIGFGTFKKVRRAAREGRNPQTGAKIKISARNAVTFKAGKALKEAVN